MSIFNNKDKLEYFKNNVQGSEEQGDFDPSQYYYNRDSSTDGLQQHQLQNGYNADSYGNSLQRQQMQQQSLRSGQPSDQTHYMNSTGGIARAGGSYGQQGGSGLSGLSLNGSSNPNLSGMYGSGLGSGNRSIGDLGGTPIPNPNLGSRVISAGHHSSNGGQQQQFDSSFPSLSSTGSSSLLMGGTARGYSAVAQLGAQTPLGGLGRDQDFTIASGDFPALPGSSLLNKGLADQVVGSQENKLIASQQQSGSQILNQGANNMFSGSGSMLGSESDSSLQSHPLLGGISTTQSGAVSQAVTKEQKFGLAGLLDVIRFTDKDINALALGTDLTTFGLNLNSSDSLYPSFSSPFTDVAQTPDPQFTTPACYMMHPPSLKSEHLSKFQIETLFYMFYAMPKDILQACASQELYRRDWRFHGELKLWLKPRAPLELMQSHPNVQFVFFDSGAWETRLFVSPHRGSIAAGLLSEEEVRVKVPQPNSIPLGGALA